MATALGDVTKSRPPELQLVKTLFLRQQFRPCIQACRDALEHGRDDGGVQPVREAFIHFYLGLAHDEIARAMHEHSTAKVPTFNEATQFYQQALDALSVEAVILDHIMESCAPTDDTFTATSYYGGAPPSETSSSSSSSSSPTPIARPKKWLGHESVEVMAFSDSQQGLFRPASVSSSTSDLEELDAPPEFHQLRSASQTITRDYSRMSLLESPLVRLPSGLPGTTPKGLMKPIRPGSPAKPYQPPTVQQPTHEQPSRLARSATSAILPKLVTTSPSPLRQSYTLPSPPPPPAEDRPPVSPVSPLLDDVVSDCSNISPVTPTTPELPVQPAYVPTKPPACGAQAPQPSIAQPPSQEETLHRQRIHDHIINMRKQLQTHIDLAERAKSRALEAQSQRAASRTTRRRGCIIAPSSLRLINANLENAGPDPHPLQSTRTCRNDKPMQQDRSFWSFTPPDQRAAELRWRIEQGRARGWAKRPVRFDASKYAALAEAALAEL